MGFGCGVERFSDDELGGDEEAEEIIVREAAIVGIGIGAAVIHHHVGVIRHKGVHGLSVLLFIKGLDAGDERLRCRMYGERQIIIIKIISIYLISYYQSN